MISVYVHQGCEFGNFRKFSAGNLRKFPEVDSNLSGNLLTTYVNQLFQSSALQSDAVK